ncbi:MAG: hypothetical protein ABSE51_13430 [Terracidiphilus sp.]|jgi:anti-sigma-K factor RskA
MNDKNGRLDSLIDHALASYTPQEARPGLEKRVLASISSTAEVSRPRTWHWRPVWMLAAAALLAVIAIPVAFKLTRPTNAVVRPPRCR